MPPRKNSAPFTIFKPKEQQIMSEHSVTIKDIAQKLKLSVSTVSRALRGNPDIKKETRELVLELAAYLNYTPNPIALSLREKKTKLIGVIVPEIANNFCSATIAGIEDIAYNKGYHVMIFQSHENFEREVINTKLLALRRVDGLIISLSNETNRYEHIQEVIDKGVPVVMFDRVCDEIKTHKVVVNDYFGAFQATEHLIQQGYHDIAHVTVADFLSITQNRLNGYIDALKKYNIPVREDRIIHCNFNTDDIHKVIRNLFSSDDKPNAILASAERLAIGCFAAVREMDLRIPEDVALIGFSDNPLNNILTPSLSCVRQPTFEIGQKSVELLLDLIQNDTVQATKNFKTLQLDTILEVMNSTRRL